MRPVFFLFVALVIVAADCASKFFIMELFLREEFQDGPGMIEILPFFNIVEVWNKGISFGLFNHETDYGSVILIVLALAIAGVFAVWLFRVRDVYQSVGIAMVIGGALGNVIDRVRFGAVYDFLDFHAFGYHWPAFNIADSCIVVGVGVLVIHSFVVGKRLPEGA